MTKQLIFEIGCEEIPARFMTATLEQIKTTFLGRCKDARITLSAPRMLGTPRRLTMIVDTVQPLQADLEEERTGPPEKAAYRDGQPTKAAEGFARGQGVSVDDLYLVDTPKGKYLAAKVFEKGLPVEKLLPEILQDTLEKLNFPKSMRWAANREQFARPVRWILAMLDQDVLPVSYTNVTSGNITYGHRFASSGPIELDHIDNYETLLKEAHVTVDPSIRREQILSMANAEAAKIGGELLDDPELLDEVVHLIEEPHAVLVTYNEEYLELPDEVLISSMRSHQRYFAVIDPQTRKLTNACVVIYNTPVRDPDVVRAGNLRVLRARLDDAKFFWDQDSSTTLEQRVEQLQSVIWLKKLGTMQQRSIRMSALTAKLGERLELDNTHIDAASRAAYLSKADLVSHVVYEFPDLQGVIGREYAIKDGEGEEVGMAIHEQYLPKGGDDALPSTDAGALVALSERLDALMGIFGIGLIPKGNADPYALRRAAIGVLRIIQGQAYDLGITEILEMAWQVYDEHNLTEAFTADHDTLIALVEDFLLTRQKHMLAADFPGDVVDAVLSVSEGDILSARDRVAALAELRQEADFEPLAIGFKRVVNILRKQADEQEDIPATVNSELLTETQEKELFVRASNISQPVEDAVKTRNWTGACQALITLKKPIDDFFDHVMVMDENEALKQNRLALLDMIRNLFVQVADISKIQTGN